MRSRALPDAFENVGAAIRQRMAVDPFFQAGVYGLLAAMTAFAGTYLLTGVTVGGIAPWRTVRGDSTLVAAALEVLLESGPTAPAMQVPADFLSALALAGVAARFLRHWLDSAEDDVSWFQCALQGVMVVPTYLVSLGVLAVAVGQPDPVGPVLGTVTYAAVGGILGYAYHRGVPVTASLGAGAVASVAGVGSFLLTYSGGLAVRAPLSPVGNVNVPAWMAAVWLYLNKRGFGLTASLDVTGTTTFEALGLYHLSPLWASAGGVFVAFLAAAVLGFRWSNPGAGGTDDTESDGTVPPGYPLQVGVIVAVGWIGTDVGLSSVAVFDEGLVVTPSLGLGSVLGAFALSVAVATVGVSLGLARPSLTEPVRALTSPAEFVGSLPEADPQAIWRTALAWRRSATGSLVRRPVDRLYLSGIVLAGSYTYYAGLGAFPLLPWDEGVYANAARSMLRGHWLVPRIHWLVHRVTEVPFLEKPPLSMWTQALSMSVFGTNPFGVRFPSATAVVLTAVVLYLFGRAVHSRRAGLAMGVVCLASTHLYAGINAGRMGTTDTTLAFFGAVFVCATWFAVTRERTYQWFVVANVGAAGAVLTKGFAAGPFLLVVLPLVVWRWRVFRSRSFAKSLLVGVALILPWFLYAWATHPDELVAQLWTEQVYRRAVGDFGPDASNTLFAFMRYPYFGNLNALLDPWGYVLAVAIPVGLYRAATGDTDRGRTLLYLWWATAIFGFYVVLGMYSWYVIPMYAPLALFLGEFVADAVRGDALARATVAVGALATLLFSARFAVWFPTAFDSLGVYPTAPPSGFPALLALVVGTVTVVGAPYLRERYRSVAADGTVHEVVPVALAVVFVLGATAPVSVNDTVWHRTQGPFGQIAHENVPSDETIHMHESVLDNAAWFGFQFYADRDLQQASLAEMNRGEQVRYAIVREVSLAELDRPYDVLAMVTMPEQPRFNRERRQVILVKFDPKDG